MDYYVKKNDSKNKDIEIQKLVVYNNRNNHTCKNCVHGKLEVDIMDEYSCDKRNRLVTGYITSNCQDFEFSEFILDLKYGVPKDTKIKKNEVIEKVNDILFGVKLKTNDEIIEDLNKLNEWISNKGNKGECGSCNLTYCNKYGNRDTRFIPNSFCSCKEWQ